MAVLAVVALGLAATAVPALAAAPARPWPPRLELAGPGSGEPALREALARDRNWLASRPAALLVAPVDGDSTAIVAWLREAERQRPRAPVDSAGADPAAVPRRGHRDLLAELRDRWLERGYLAAAVSLADTGASDRAATVRVAPGPLFRLGELRVEGDPFEGRERLLDAWLPRSGDPFRPEDYLAAAAGIVTACAERGYPFPVWLTRSLALDPEAARVDVIALLLPGTRAVVGMQATTLPTARGERFLIRAAGLRHGSRYRESDLRRGTDRLLARDLYTRVDEPLVHLTAARDTVGILWRVVPLERANRLGVVLGLSRKEEGGTRLSGQVDLELPNLAGTGRRLAAGWSDDGDRRSHFGFSYLEPLVLGTPLDTDLALDSEVEKDSYTRFRLDNRWRLPVVSLWGVELGIGWDRATYPTGDLESTKRLRGRVALRHSRGDRARSGWSGTFAIETASRSSTLRPAAADTGAGAGGELGSQDNQRLLEGDLAGEVWLRSTVSLAGRASFRQNDADVRPVPLPEQYRFGGANTVRGYREGEFHGETAAWGGVELRLGRAHRSRVYTFVDVGYFEFSVRVEDAERTLLETRSGTNLGFGLGLVTAAAAGELNLAVGFPGDVDFATAKLHVSLLGNF